MRDHQDDWDETRERAEQVRKLREQVKMTPQVREGVQALRNLLMVQGDELCKTQGDAAVVHLWALASWAGEILRCQ